jgi:prepilin-type N-terminal cleavage/methylation domain-containing protein
LKNLYNNRYAMTNTRCHGFSLIELMITITLCVLIVTITVVNVSFLHRGTVRSEVEKLYSACMYLQQRALCSGQECILEFDEIHERYRFDGKVEQFDAAVHFGVPPGVKGPPSEPRNLVTSPITFAGTRIIFYPDGVISSGTVYLTDTKRSTVYALSSAVAQISHLRKYSYTDSWKLLP